MGSDNINAHVTPLSEEKRGELERRWVEGEADPDDVVPWDEVKRKAVERLGR